MKKYPLQQLLDLRQRREDNAAKVLLKAQQAAEASRLERDRTRQQLIDFQEERAVAERQKYAEVIGQRVNRMRLEMLFQDLLELAERESACEERLLEAEHALEQRLAEKEQASVGYRTAYRDREKIAEHRRRWLLDEALAAEQAMDKELEDFRVILNIE